MANIGAAVHGLLVLARRAAQARRQRLTSAHALLAMLQTDLETGALLAALEVDEGTLLSALKVVDQEPGTALDIAIEQSQKLADRFGEPTVRPMHLLLALAREQRTAAHACLEHTGVSASRVQDEIVARLDPEGRTLTTAPRWPDVTGSRRPSTSPPPRLTGPAFEPSSRRLAEARAASAARAAKTTPPPTPENLRLPRPRSEAPRPSPSSRRLAPTARRGAPHPASPSPRPRDAQAGEIASVEPAIESKSEPLGAFELDRDRFPMLTALGRNLSMLAEQGRIDPVIGRDAEIEKLLDVLARRRSNNPVLVGAPGVGKTAIVEGLALRLARGGRGVAGLEGKILVEVSAGSLVSGTGVRGALAERMQRLRTEVLRSDGRVLLFLDEIHAVLGGPEGPDDLASELKAALARGELPCIGATTDAEYRRVFERDPAFARRFSRIEVGEPKAEDAIAILCGIVPRYEAHHNVRYELEAIEASVELSVRFLTDRQLPDKALALLDLAGARVSRRGGDRVDLEAVAHVVSEQAHVPLERLLMRDSERLLVLERHLEERIVGQRRPIARIAEALRKGAAGFRGPRPLGTFLLLGPTGVGKTETAKAIADLLFASGGVTRFDMSELSESHAVARMVGAPPGYLGHDHGGQLTEAVRRRPYQLLLLDEIEKAHPEVLLALLPLLDEGRLTDGRGRTVDFTNTVVVMTSNLGADTTPSRASIGFGGAASEDAHAGLAERAIAAARRALPPELWNRIDEPLYFSPLSENDVREIARRMLSGVAAALVREHGVALRIDESVIDVLVRSGGFDAALGARPMRRTVGRLVEAPLATWVLSGGGAASGPLRLLGDGDRVRIEPADDAEAAE